MGTLVIFVVWLLINWLGNVAETFTDILNKICEMYVVKKYFKFYT